MEKLDPAEIESKLANISEWSEINDSIQRTYSFDDFVASIRFVNTVADAAEAANHHPDMLIRYNKVTVTLSTHDAGGITNNDFDLAAKCDEAAGG